MKKKIVGGLLLASMSLLVACSGAKSAQRESGIKTVSSGKLIMSTNAEFPPYEYHESDKIVGIDVEIAEAIAKKLNLELEIEDIAFSAVITQVVSGKADIGMAGISITEERKVNVNFSDTYATASQMIILKDGSDIKSPDDLKGKTIGVQEGTTGDILSGDIENATVERYNRGVEAIQALTQGKVDAVIIDLEPAKVFVEQTEGIFMLEEAFTTEEYAIAINKENTALLEAVNKALAELEADGTVDAIIAKYINAQ